jgi:hypothetical protein
MMAHPLQTTEKTYISINDGASNSFINVAPLWSTPMVMVLVAFHTYKNITMMAHPLQTVEKHVSPTMMAHPSLPWMLHLYRPYGWLEFL